MQSNYQSVPFLKVGLAQYNIQSNAELITQDLNCIDVGQVVAKGDSLEMQYTGWLHAGNTFGKVSTINYNYHTLTLLDMMISQKASQSWQKIITGSARPYFVSGKKNFNSIVCRDYQDTVFQKAESLCASTIFHIFTK